MTCAINRNSRPSSSLTLRAASLSPGRQCSIKPHGHIVFTGCAVAAEDIKLDTWEDIDGKAYVDSFYIASGRRRPTIHAYNETITHAENKLHLSTTHGAEHSTPSQ